MTETALISWQQLLKKHHWATLVVWMLLLCVSTRIAADSGDAQTPPEIAPYLLRLAPDSAVLSWVTPEPRSSSGTLTSTQARLAFNDPSPVRFHKQVFQGLIAGTTYRYVVDDVFTGAFRTPEEHNEFRLVALGHTHGSEVPDHYPDEFLVARVAELRPELVLHTGDITWYSNYEEFGRYFFSLFQKLLAHTPVLVAPGNHDMNLGVGAFRQLFPHDYGAEREAYYRIDYKNLRILALSYMTLGRKTSRQLEWLEQELKTSPQEFNIVVWGGTHLPEELNRTFYQTLARHRVDLLLGGDGAGVRLETVEGIPYAYVGTSVKVPHSLYVLDIRAYEILLRRIDARGATPDPHLRIASRKAHPLAHDILALPGLVREVRPVGEDVAQPEQDTFDLPQFKAGTSLVAHGFSIPSRSFDGVRIVAECQGAPRGTFRIKWSSHEATGKGVRTPNHQSQYFYLAPGRNEFRVPLPVADPSTRQEYHLSAIHVAITHSGCKDGARIEAMELFRH